MLILVGLGLSKDLITKAAITILEKCDEVLIDSYTSFWYPSIDYLAKELMNKGVSVKICKRRDLEGPSITEIVKRSKHMNVCIAIPGDPLFATTHVAILAEAGRYGVRVSIVPGVSIVNAVYAYTCLQPYRFGKIATVVSPKEGIFFEYPLMVIKDNLDRNLHTILLLEIDFDTGYFMTPNEAIRLLLEAQRRLGIEVLREETKIFILSSIGSKKQCVEYTTIHNVIKGLNQCKEPPATIVIPSPKLHPVEEECIDALYSKNLLELQAH